MKSLSVAALAFVACVPSAFACGVQGSASRTDGSKVDGSATISSSWNGTKAFPRNGYYNLDLGGSACGQVVSLYVGGDEFARLRLPNSGNARADVVLKGTSNTPVR